LWSAAALTATAVSTNAYDAGTSAVSGGTQQDVSQGKSLVAVLCVGVAAASGGTQTYEFDVVCADDNALSVNLTTLAQYAFTTTQAASLLTAGAIIILPIPQGSLTREYVGLKFIGANTPTITVTAWITSSDMTMQQRQYSTLIAILG
jgi:hypothetical protein